MPFELNLKPRNEGSWNSGKNKASKTNKTKSSAKANKEVMTVRVSPENSVKRLLCFLCAQVLYGPRLPVFIPGMCWKEFGRKVRQNTVRRS